MFFKRGKGSSGRTVVVVNSLKVDHMSELSSWNGGNVVFLQRVKERTDRGTEEEEVLMWVFLHFRTDAIKTRGVRSDGMNFSGYQGE